MMTCGCVEWYDSAVLIGSEYGDSSTSDLFRVAETCSRVTDESNSGGNAVGGRRRKG